MDEVGASRALATRSRPDERTRVLLHQDAFAVLGHSGDLVPGGVGEQGLYRDGMRHLSRLELTLQRNRPFFVGHPVADRPDVLAVTLTTPDLLRDGEVDVELGQLCVERTMFLQDGVLYAELALHNYGLERELVTVELTFEADWADLQEVGGAGRHRRRGEVLPAELHRDRVVLGYRGRDGVVRRTVIAFDPAPAALDGAVARLEVRIGPGGSAVRRFSVACASADDGPPRVRTWTRARRRQPVRPPLPIATDHARFDRWVAQALLDVDLLTVELPTGPYPFAGVPWFHAPFGRDALVTALETLPFRPDLARGVLAFLAATQAEAVDEERDAEPGKVLHEARSGEMAALGEVPFGRYYGSVDATPLFVVVAGAYLERTGERAFVERIWPNVLAALRWIDQHGDGDGDGFVDYRRRSRRGLVNQGWRDSDSAVFHADGTLATAPVAPCEVQGYVHAARLAAARMAELLGDPALAGEQRRRAKELEEQFDAAFWSDALGAFVIARDARGPCEVLGSSAGQCLFGGIVKAHRVDALVHTLRSPELDSGWGLRTVALSATRYNPMGYHTGTVWPHDTALVAYGLARYGRTDEAARLCSALFEAAAAFPDNRMPELFCGFPRESCRAPMAYPVACAPQAWSAGAVLLLLRAALGLEVDALAGRVTVTRPCLPQPLRELEIRDLEAGDGVVDLRFARRGDETVVEVTRQERVAVDVLSTYVGDGGGSAWPPQATSSSRR